MSSKKNQAKASAKWINTVREALDKNPDIPSKLKDGKKRRYFIYDREIKDIDTARKHRPKGER